MKTILIIENEKNIAELERINLEMNGFKTDIENDGTRGLIRALEENYDFIITELTLPETNGIEICQKLRKEKDVPIMIVSAKKDHIVQALELGADDFMTKPFNPQELVARVKAHLRRYQCLDSRESKQQNVSQ